MALGILTSRAMRRTGRIAIESTVVETVNRETTIVEIGDATMTGGNKVLESLEGGGVEAQIFPETEIAIARLTDDEYEIDINAVRFAASTVIDGIVHTSEGVGGAGFAGLRNVFLKRSSSGLL